MLGLAPEAGRVAHEWPVRSGVAIFLGSGAKVEAAATLLLIGVALPILPPGRDPWPRWWRFPPGNGGGWGRVEGLDRLVWYVLVLGR